MRQGELGDRLTENREQRVGSFELERRRPRALPGTQRLRRANGEGAQPVDVAPRGRASGPERELKDAERRLAQRERGDRSALDRLDADRLVLDRQRG